MAKFKELGGTRWFSISPFPFYIIAVSDYEFVTVWRFDAPIEAVWEEIEHSDRWNECWKVVLSVVELKELPQTAAIEFAKGTRLDQFGRSRLRSHG